MTPLQALKEYKKRNEYGVNVYADEYLDTIEKALKRLEMLEEEKQSFDIKLGKKLKALNIIKKKRVNVDNFLNHIKEDTDYKEYERLDGLYIITIFSEKELTEQEFDLLKEILR